MAKKKQTKTYRFRVPYHVEAECKGTAIVEMEEDELQFKRGKVDMEVLKADFIDQVPHWAEGYQNICSGGSLTGVSADYETQNDEWCYWPERVSVGDIEDISDEEEVVCIADIQPHHMEVYLPMPKGAVKNPEYYECEVPADVPVPIRATIWAEPDAPLKLDIHAKRRSDTENVLRWLSKGDFTCDTKKKVTEVHKLINQCTKH
jgi:hypothetical protein